MRIHGKSNFVSYLPGIWIVLLAVCLSLTVAAQTPTHLSLSVRSAIDSSPPSDGLLKPKITLPLIFVGRFKDLSKVSLTESSFPVEASDVMNDLADSKPKPLVLPKPSDASSNSQPESHRGFDWNSALKQAFLFNTFLQGFRIATEPEVRAELGGPFFKDYFRSVKSLRGWGDGDNFLTNYVGHPMQGAVSARIQIQNEPKGRMQEFALRKEYFTSRVKAMGFAAMFSVNFELGPLSESSIGNVGMKPREKSRNPMAFEDLVVTPTVGTAWLVAEDALDRFLARNLESKISNRALKALVRSGLNPTRSMANLMRFKFPWYRDNRRL
jgi:hypothetical protein